MDIQQLLFSHFKTPKRRSPRKENIMTKAVKPLFDTVRRLTGGFLRHERELMAAWKIYRRAIQAPAATYSDRVEALTEFTEKAVLIQSRLLRASAYAHQENVRQEDLQLKDEAPYLGQ